MGTASVFFFPPSQGLPTVASLFDGTSSSPSKSNAAADFPGGMDGWAGRVGGELGLDAMLTPPKNACPVVWIFFLLISLTQDMNCKMSNYLMKIHPRLAKCGRRLGMSVPRGTKPTSPRLVVAIRTINAHYVPNEPWMTCLLFRVLAHRQASVCSSSSVLIRQAQRESTRLPMESIQEIPRRHQGFAERGGPTPHV